MDAVVLIFEKVLQMSTREVGAYSFQCKSQRKVHLMRVELKGLQRSDNLKKGGG